MKVCGTDTHLSSALREQRKRECAGSLCVRRNGLTAKSREFHVITGFGPDHNLGVYNNTVDTIERAFTERYFLCKDGEGFRPAFKVGPSSFTTAELSEFRKRVMDTMPHLPVMTSTQVVNSYHGYKRRVYQNAYESVQQDPVTERDSRLTSFVKFEKQDVDKAPRVINPRSARYNLRLGKYLKHAEHHFFKSINKAFGARTRATVIKGYNADVSAEILSAKWNNFDNPVAIGLDASKFDMHVSQRALRYEHSFYRELFPGNKELSRLLNWQLVNKGVAFVRDGSVKFEMEGTRSSGDLNTSLGNCILMCAMVWAYAREMHIDLELANNGDDCVVFMEKEHAQLFRSNVDSWFRTRGFSMTVEDTVTEFEQVEFCQTKPVMLSSGWRMVRNLRAVITKDPMCLLSVPNTKVMQKWLHAVGTCGTMLCTGVPVHDAFYRCMLRHGVDNAGLINEVYKNRSQLSLADGVKRALIDSVARVSYYYAFGVTPDEQLALEQYYDSLSLDFGVGQAIERMALVLEPGVNLISHI